MVLPRDNNAPRSKPMFVRTRNGKLCSYPMARLMKTGLSFYLILLLGTLASFPVFSQEKTAALSETARWASTINEHYWIQPDITYGVANNYTLKLDMWQRKDAKTAAPTL